MLTQTLLQKGFYAQNIIGKLKTKVFEDTKELAVSISIIVIIKMEVTI